MSSYSLNTAASLSGVNEADQPKLLNEMLAVVAAQAHHMKSSLVLTFNQASDALMDAFKAASAMLSELRTASLGPKHYYTLYIAVFDELGYLSRYLYDSHLAGLHHLADLYELVQYAGSIIPRRIFLFK